MQASVCVCVRQTEFTWRSKGSLSLIAEPTQDIRCSCCNHNVHNVQIRNQEASGEQPITIINTIKNNAPTLWHTQSLPLTLNLLIFYSITSTWPPLTLSISLYVSLIYTQVLSHGLTSLCLAQELILSWTKTLTEKPMLGQWLGEKINK